MKHFTNIASALALISLSQPACAGVREAAFGTSSDRAETRTGMFVGATYRVGFDGRSHDRNGQASFNIAGLTQASGRAFQLRPGLDLAANPGAPLRMSIGGVPAKQLEQRLNMSGGAKTVLIVGGAVLLVGGAVLVAGMHEWKHTDILGDD